jgi:hypothetical protein
MLQLNWKRLILGGLLAGVIIDACELLVNGVLFASNWSAVMQSLNRPTTFSLKQMVALNLWGFLTGIAMTWLYASLRPRYGAGPRTAVIAGVGMWFMNYALGGAFPIIVHMFPRRLSAITLLLALVEAVVAALAGASIYQEESQPHPKSRAASA